jgi:NAD(P)H-dependent flavin oxidoreductase YrpB (nitropropane dioxygenase family)
MNQPGDTAAASHPALRTRVCELFGIRYPIVQTGMGYVSGPELTAATAEAGGLGIIGGGSMTYDELVIAVHRVKELTDRPFGVNMRASQADVDQRVDLLIRERVRVASFALAPSERVIGRLKDAGVVVVPSIGARRHAEKVAAWGVDAVIAQGGEGGGHTGAVPSSLLLPQVVDAVDIPVIAAGGYFDGRGLVSALAFGAAGIAMGTRFLLTSDSTVAEAVKAVYLRSTVNDTVLTSEVDGVPQRLLRAGSIKPLLDTSGPRRYVRAVRNALAFQRLSGTPWREMIREGVDMKRSHELAWRQVIMAANAPMLYRTALMDGNAELGVMATGQVVGLIDDLPSCAELIGRIMAEASKVLTGLAG